MKQNQTDNELLSNKNVVGRTVLLSEGLNEDCLRVSTKLNYFLLIHQLNQLGKSFTRNGYTRKQREQIIPNYKRVILYRNKILEHWDDYCKERDVRFHSLDNGIPVPYFYGECGTKDEVNNRKSVLDNEFKKHSGGVGFFDERFDGCVYRALEFIDPNLSFPDDKGYHGLFKVLLEHSIPAPINNIEDYCAQLVENISKEFQNELNEISVLSSRLRNK